MKQMERKKILLVLLCGCLLIFTLGLSACGSTEESAETDTEISTEEATLLTEEELLDIAFTDAGFHVTAGKDIKVSVSKDSIRTITFNISDASYSYEINEITGEIVNSTKPEVAPDTDVNPVEVAMSKLGSVKEFQGASNISAKLEQVDGKDAVVVTFDNNGESYKYIYDIGSGKLSKSK